MFFIGILLRREFTTRPCRSPLHPPVLHARPEFPHSKVDHCYVFDGEQAEVVVSALLLYLKQHVEIDAKPEEGAIHLENPFSQPL